MPLNASVPFDLSYWNKDGKSWGEPSTAGGPRQRRVEEEIHSERWQNSFMYLHFSVLHEALNVQFDTVREKFIQQVSHLNNIYCFLKLPASGPRQTVAMVERNIETGNKQRFYWSVHINILPERFCSCVLLQWTQLTFDSYNRFKGKTWQTAREQVHKQTIRPIKRENETCCQVKGHNWTSTWTSLNSVCWKPWICKMFAPSKDKKTPTACHLFSLSHWLHMIMCLFTFNQSYNLSLTLESIWFLNHRQDSGSESGLWYQSPHTKV